MIATLTASTMTALLMQAASAGQPSSSAIRLRDDGPALTVEAAKALTPAALGDALLAPGHPPVLEAIVGPQGIQPPPAPGMPVTTRVTLYLQPERGARADFCTRPVVSVTLAPVYRSSAGELPPARPDRIATETAYRWVGMDRRASACAAPRYRYFVPRAGERQQALDTVRLLAVASRQARRGRIAFPVSVDDRLGPEMVAFARAHPERPSIPGMKIIADARQALAALPVDAVTFVGPAATVWPDLLSAADLRTSDGRRAEGTILFLGGDWTVGLVIADGRIIRVRMLRQIPPPF